MTHAGGRPSKYTQELADQICAELARGKSLRTILGTGGVDDTDEQRALPSIATIFTWFRTYPEFLEQYARAKQESADAMSDEILDISDDGTNDWMEDQYMKGKSPGWKVNGEAVQRSKLRVDTRKWLMAKMKPKKYGDQLDITSGGDKLPQPLLGVINPLENTTDDITEEK